MDGWSSAGGSAVVVPFVPRPAHPLSLNVPERIQAMQWADAARSHGVRELRIHEPHAGDDPALGCFLLIYEAQDIWAAWGVAVRRGSFEVWRPASGPTVGVPHAARGAGRHQGRGVTPQLSFR
jgi:hypothetical protein